MEASSSTPERGPSPRRLGASLLGLLYGHVALISEELKEQRTQAVQLSLWAGLCLVFALLLLIGVSVMLLIVFWDTYRVETALSLCGFYALGVLFCAMRLIGTLHSANPPFSASLEELARDREQLLP